jgi:hypothetical protein
MSLHRTVGGSDFGTSISYNVITLQIFCVNRMTSFSAVSLMAMVPERECRMPTLIVSAACVTPENASDPARTDTAAAVLIADFIRKSPCERYYAATTIARRVPIEKKCRKSLLYIIILQLG